MSRNILRILIVPLLIQGFLLTAEPVYRWYKGNTHCHTLNSDGNVYARQVVRWYRDREYHFLVISDHNYLTDIKYLDTDPRDDFILIPGEEVTDSYDGIPVHLNAINTRTLIQPQGGDSITQTLQNNINAILKAGALPQINHPNWRWAFDDKEISELKGCKLFELYNTSTGCNNFSAGGKAGTEDIWDRLLSKGMEIYGIASDDAHHYLSGVDTTNSNPGTSWIMVRAKELSIEAIVNALREGDFYATFGIILEDITLRADKYSLSIKPHSDVKYTTFFIGKGGKIIHSEFGLNPSYTIRGNEMYVRARVFSSNGEIACTQPMFISKK